MSSEGAKRREEARAKYGDQLRATFKKVDKDNSGSATIDEMWWVNRYGRKRPKVDASIFDSALSHTRRLDASEKKRRK